MKKNKGLKIVLIGITLLVIISGIGRLLGWWGKPPVTEVTSEKVQNRTIVESVSASGKVQPEMEVKISPDVSGEIVELYVAEGQQVKKGDLLCKIKPDLYESALNRSEAALNTAKANYSNSQARLAQVEAQFSNLKAQFERNKKLFDQGALSQQEFDASKAQYEGALADVRAAEETVKASQFNINSAQAGLKESNDNLNRTTIYSPVNGIVSKLNVEKGERVVGTSQMAGTEIMRIANLNDMEVNVEVNENDIVKVSLGDTADIEVDAYLDRKFKGVVTEIANSANTQGVSADQVTNFSVKIRILSESYSDLTSGKPANFSPFRPGMSATVEIKTNSVKDVISVPISAVTTREPESVEASKNEKGPKKEAETTEDGTEKVEKKDFKIQEYVFLVKEGKAVLTKVKSGIQDNNYIQVLSGLKQGEEVVSGPYTLVSKSLKDKEIIKVVSKEDLFNKTKK